MGCIQPTNVELCKGQIIVNARNQGAKLKFVMQNLDSLGYIHGSCGFLNDPYRMNKVTHNLELADSIAEIKWIKDDTSAEKKDNRATKIIELAQKAEKQLAKAVYTVGADLGEFTSSWDFAKGCIASILGLVYKNTISDSKSKKHNINKLSVKVSIYGGDNKLRAYLVSDSDYVAYRNEDTISNSNGNTITNINVKMVVAV